MATFNDVNQATGLQGLGPLPGKAPVAAFNLDAVENLLRTKGILAFHARHALSYSRETVEAGRDLSESAQERSFDYYDIRPILVVPQSFNFNDTMTLMSLHASGTVVLNVTGQYLDTDSPARVLVRPRDLILLNPEMTSMHEELFTYKGQSELLLHHRIKRVDYLACTSQDRMEQDVDFMVSSSGAIQFISGMKVPKVGEVVSAVYEYAPIFVVRAVPHAIRVLPSNSSGHGSSPRTAMYGPQYVIADLSAVRDDEYSVNWWQTLEDLDWRQWQPNVAS
jgi:hypothetical protein